MSDAPALPPTAAPLRAYLVILMGIAAVALSAIFIRLAQADGVPSLVIAALRLTFASLILTPITLFRHLPEIRRLRRADLGWALFSGCFLALHFATWILSLEYASVLVSNVLVTTSPLWGAILEVLFLRARLGRLVIIGLVVGMAGSLIAALASSGSQFADAENPFLGGLLAIIGALGVAVYWVIGRKLRAELSLLPYIWLVYGCAAIVLLLAVAIFRLPLTGYPSESYLWLLAMAVFPQLLGHSSFNFALKYFPATYVALATQTEPILSALFAFFLFTEIPLTAEIIGSMIVLAGVTIASVGQSRST